MAITNGTFDTDISGWSPSGTDNYDVIWDDGRARLRVFRCSNAYMEQTFVIDKNTLTFDWQTYSDIWYENVNWDLIIDGTTVISEGFPIAFVGGYSGTRTIGIPMYVGQTATIKFQVTPGIYCGNSDHENTYLWVDNITLTDTTTIGTLDISSTPSGAAIYIDDVLTGITTPAVIPGLSTGSHTYKLTYPLYYDATETFTITESTTTTLSIVMVQLPGTLDISSTPSGAEIFIDGGDTGFTTPNTISDLIPGDHDVNLTYPLYYDATETFTIMAGTTTTLSIVMIPLPGEIVLDSIPQGAEIFLDGIDKGVVTPSTLTNIIPGNRIIILKLSGYIDRMLTVTVVSQQTAAITTSLSPTSNLLTDVRCASYKFHGDLRNSGQSIYPSYTDGTIKWTYSTKRSVEGSPAIDVDGTIYVGDDDGNFYAINPDGTLKWTYPSGGSDYSSPAIGSDGTIYNFGRDPTTRIYGLYAFYPDGTLKWHFDIGSWSMASPTIGLDGNIYIGTRIGLYAIDPNGNQVWLNNTFTNTENNCPAISPIDGTIYAKVSDGTSLYICAFNSINGNVIWSTRISDQRWGNQSPSIAEDGTIYIATTGSSCYLYAINPIPAETTIERTSITTTGSYSRYYPQLQVVGSTIYYTWLESDGYQIAIATSNLDGTNFNRTNITTGNEKSRPQLQVVDSTIYYTWIESDDFYIYQIATGTSNLDGTSFNKTNITTGNPKNFPQLQVVGSTIYYTWSEFDGAVYQIATGTSNLDGTGFNKTNITTNASDKQVPQLQVDGSTIYYTWVEFDGANYQIAIATSNLDGTSFNKTNITTSAFDKDSPQLQVVGSIIYYTWNESDGVSFQIATGTSNLDGTNFKETTSFTPTTLGRYVSQLQVVGPTIYYIWQEYDGVNFQIATGTTDLDGSNFIQMDVTTSPYYKSDPQLQVVGSTVYFAWGESDGSIDQIAIGTTILPSTRLINWQYRIGNYQTDSYPTIATDGTIYIGNGDYYDPKLYAINPNGTLKWFYPVRSTLYSSPTIDLGGNIYFGTDGIWDPSLGYSIARFYAFNPDGTLRWYKDIPSYNIESPPSIAPDGTIYTGVDHGATLNIGLVAFQSTYIAPPTEPCTTTPKYSGDTVTVYATPNNGIGPYYVEFRKNGIKIPSSRLQDQPNPIIDAPENILITRFYTLDDLDISSASSGTINFSVFISDSCPTGAHTCTETCTLSIACMTPVCNFTVA